MPSLRYTDGSPRAIECRTCGTTHRTDRPCPPANKWLATDAPLKGVNLRTPDPDPTPTEADAA